VPNCNKLSHSSRSSKPDPKLRISQVATDLINQLKRTHQKIEKDLQKLETSAVEEIEQEKDDIDAGRDKLRAGLAQLATKLKIEPRKRAS
jgi:hypothetical protein